MIAKNTYFLKVPTLPAAKIKIAAKLFSRQTPGQFIAKYLF